MLPNLIIKNIFKNIPNVVAFYFINTFFYDPEIFKCSKITYSSAVKFGLGLPISSSKKMKNHQLW